ncbi:MAG: preprotein translocase subunit SecA [Kiritimatiellae bacterium]|nr:preprotein translocase subunit SecA [Kiritimatiellia bacterium]
MNILKAIFGTKAQRDVKRLRPMVERINALEVEYQKLSDDQLKAKTEEFRARLAKGETLDDILCEAFATVKNACRRLCGTTREVCGHELTWDMIPFDVQLIGGIVLHQGKIAEMQTGEGKTLVATLPLYLNALAGKNVQLVTVNDYLARRDSQWMGLVYEFLGLTVGCIQNSMSPAERRAQYNCDITYGTNSEFGFDYLRDNGMAVDRQQLVQNGHNFAIIDEVDSILIDEARTPLIISGPAAESSHQYDLLKPQIEHLVRKQRDLCNDIARDVKEAYDAGDRDAAMEGLYKLYHGMPKHKQFLHLIEDPAVRKLHEDVESMMLTEMRKDQARALTEKLLFTIDEKSREVALTDRGCEELNPDDPEMFVIPDLATAMSALEGDKSLSGPERTEKRRALQAEFTVRSERVQNCDQLLRAYCLYERDVDYVVQDNHVLIVDEFTGRILPGRRWSDGLHQAVEAKEGVQIERETQTLATITIQNYFRLYKKLAGMTGTAETEASEFKEIYKLDVVPIPTNRPIRRIDQNDLIYKTQREKFAAIVQEVSECHAKGQPVLLGTVNVDTSEILSRLLRLAKIPHSVLNAKNHAKEAEIVANAGQPGAVTIATNMAGRGTDIKLGPGVVWVPEEIVKSNTTLDTAIEGPKTLGQLLRERPCGLYVIGSERHESRRIDRQLRGRCARQGDPGMSRFYISLEDSLMRLFGSERMAGIMSRFGMQDGEALEHPWLNRSVETAQRRVEEQNFSIRKRTLEYDDVMNKQREVIYAFRNEIILAEPEKLRERVLDVINDLVMTQSEQFMASQKDAQPQELIDWAQASFPVAVREDEIASFAGNPEGAGELIYKRIESAYADKCGFEDPQVLPIMERQVVLRAIDTQWQEFLRAMDELRHGVGLRAYGQRDPLVEYKREAYGMFEELMGTIKTEIAQSVFKFTTSFEQYQRMMQNTAVRRQQTSHASLNALAASGASSGGSSVTTSVTNGSPAVNAQFERALSRALPEEQPSAPQQPVVNGPRVGRNDPCPCGSGKKYKKCCGRGL